MKCINVNINKLNDLLHIGVIKENGLSVYTRRSSIKIKALITTLQTPLNVTCSKVCSV